MAISVYSHHHSDSTALGYLKKYTGFKDGKAFNLRRDALDYIDKIREAIEDCDCSEEYKADMRDALSKPKIEGGEITRPSRF